MNLKLYKIIEEGKAKVLVPKEEKVSKELPVFYNPVMAFNRTMSVLVLGAIENKEIQIGLPLEATGVRGIRFLKELPKSKIKSVAINDINPEAVKIIKENLKINKVKADVYNQDAPIFLITSKGFDYIDVDPFGSPNPFLDPAIKRLSREGILAVTATDTGCLCGTFPKTCLRKYWAMPARNETMHENGLRILIRKVQLIGADNNKALVPIYSYAKEHYFRIFFRCEKGKTKVDEIIENHGMYNGAGPMWLGQLWDTELVKKMIKISSAYDDEIKKFLKITETESRINAVGFYELHEFCKKHKLAIPPKAELIKRIKKAGFSASDTSFTGRGVRSDIDEKTLLKIITSF
jgi:tRNA (guanine26-N2/guanine27-N2)-dimethyltransferase